MWPFTYRCLRLRTGKATRGRVNGSQLKFFSKGVRELGLCPTTTIRSREEIVRTLESHKSEKITQKKTLDKASDIAPNWSGDRHRTTLVESNKVSTTNRHHRIAPMVSTELMVSSREKLTRAKGHQIDPVSTTGLFDED